MPAPTPEIEANDATPENGRAPREDLLRAIPEAVEFRAASDDGMPTMVGHFAVFDTWTEINSMWEGQFMERFVRGAFKKTFKDMRDRMRPLFQHGMDPQVGDKPLGPIEVLSEDETGAYYEVPLLDTSYNRDLVPGLEKGLYGASFRFSVMREEWVEEPGVSDYNPNGLPERTVKEARVMEFGPVTFPAYPQATAGLRSLTDNFLILRSSDDAGRRALLARMQTVPMLATRSQERADEPEPETEAASDATDGVNSSEARPEVAPPIQAPEHSSTPTTDAAKANRFLTTNPHEEMPPWRL